jgi:F-type H+-transporting ATPase subunit delta
VSLGQDSEKVEALGNDLASFASVLDTGEGQLRSALTNPGLTTIERKAVLDQVLVKMSLDKDTANFLRLLVDKNRLDVFDGIQRSYNEMADELAGRARATVTTATKLTAAMQKTVKSALEDSTGKTVEIDFKVDSGLISGMVAQVGDISYDASVRTRLDALQFVLTRNPGAVAEA